LEYNRLFPIIGATELTGSSVRKTQELNAIKDERMKKRYVLTDPLHLVQYKYFL